MPMSRVAERRLAHPVATDHGDGLDAHRERDAIERRADAVAGARPRPRGEARSLIRRFLREDIPETMRAPSILSGVSAGDPSTTVGHDHHRRRSRRRCSATSMSCSISSSVTFERGPSSSSSVVRVPRGQPGSRLVEHHQIGLDHPRHAHFELALLAMGEVTAPTIRCDRRATPLGRGPRSFSRDGLLRSLNVRRSDRCRPSCTEDARYRLSSTVRPAKSRVLLVRPGDAEARPDATASACKSVPRTRASRTSA